MPRFEKKSIGLWVLNQYLTQGFPSLRNQKGVEEDQAREMGTLQAGERTEISKFPPSEESGFSGRAFVTDSEATGTVKSSTGRPCSRPGPSPSAPSQDQPRAPRCHGPGSNWGVTEPPQMLSPRQAGHVQAGTGLEKPLCFPLVPQEGLKPSLIHRFASAGTQRVNSRGTGEDNHNTYD